MPRQPRIDFPGAWHHVMNRGRRKEPIFGTDGNCLLFLRTIGEAVERFGIEVHAYSLMPNHYHLLVHTPQANLSRAMAHINGVYTQAINRQQGWDGAVFRGRFKSQLATDDAYRRTLFAYLHLNPLKAGMVMDLEDQAWTSHLALTGRESPQPWLSTWAIEPLFGGPEQLDATVRHFHGGREQWPDDFDRDTGRWKAPPTEASLPPDPGKRKANLEETLLRVQEITGASRRGLRKVKRGPGSNPPRRFAVLALARETDASHREIAQALNMTIRQVGNLIYTAKKNGLTGELADWMLQLDA